jgi:hypothetical protein
MLKSVPDGSLRCTIELAIRAAGEPGDQGSFILAEPDAGPLLTGQTRDRK